MKLTFQIEYRTAWGESIGVMFEGKENNPIMLATANGIVWEGNAEFSTIVLANIRTTQIIT